MNDNKVTLPETNIAPENLWLEDEFPFGEAYSQVLLCQLKCVTNYPVT